MRNKIKRVKNKVFGSKIFRVVMYLKSAIIYAFLMFAVTWGLALWIFTTDHFFSSLLPKLILGIGLMGADVMYFSVIISPIIKNSYKVFNEGPYLAAITIALKRDSELRSIQKSLDEFYEDKRRPLSYIQRRQLDELYEAKEARKEAVRSEVKSKLRVLVDSELAMGL